MNNLIFTKIQNCLLKKKIDKSSKFCLVESIENGKEIK